MAGILDLHTLMALQNGWLTYKASVADFKGLFNAVDPTIVGEWHAALVAKPPTFRAHAATKKDGFPLVIVRMLGETLEHEPMGGMAFTDDAGVPAEEILVRQSVRVLAMTEHAELTRAMFVMVRAIMLHARPAFLAAGYLSIDYGGGDELYPEEQLVSEELGIVVREQTYHALAQVRVPEPEGVPATQAWFVLASDLKLDEDAGGVVPSSA